MLNLFEELGRRKNDNLQDGENADKDFVRIGFEDLTIIL